MLRRHSFIYVPAQLAGPLFALTLGGLGACQCDVEPLQELSGALTGQICNPLTGVPEPAAEVSLVQVGEDRPRYETQADQDGQFFLGGLPVGEYRGTVSASRFDFEIEVSVTANDTTTWVDPGCRELALPEGTGELVGQICNRHVGAYVSDAEVSVILPSGEVLSTTTNAEGNFVLSGVPVGAHVVYVRSQGYSRTYQVEILLDAQTLLDEQTRACTPPDPANTGKVVGRICADQDGVEVLGGVRVYLSEPIDGYTFEDQTADDGTFTIAGIPAPRVVQVRAEKGGFAAVFDDVSVYPLTERPDGTDLAYDDCVPLTPSDDLRLLVVNGYYDKIQHMLARMGLDDVTVVEGNPLDPRQPWASQVFGDFAALSQYDAVFVNCGVSEIEFMGGPDPLVAANLRAYVQQGGSIYVSDQAYDLVEGIWPYRVDFLFADAENSAAELGVDGRYEVEIVEPGLQRFVGADSMTIDFNFGYYALVQEVAAGSTVYLRADLNYYANDTTAVLAGAPVTVGFTDGAVGEGGRVVFSSFHQESDAVTGELEELDGPEDAVLRYLIFEL